LVANWDKKDLLVRVILLVVVAFDLPQFSFPKMEYDLFKGDAPLFFKFFIFPGFQSKFTTCSVCLKGILSILLVRGRIGVKGETEGGEKQGHVLCFVVNPTCREIGDLRKQKGGPVSLPGRPWEAVIGQRPDATVQKRHCTTCRP
jgi:hypothetical protein